MRIFPHLLPRIRVTMIRFVSFGTLVNVLFVICLLLLKTLVTWWCVMCFRKIRNGGIKWSCKYYPCCSWFKLNFIYGGNKHSHCKHNLIYGNQRSHHPKKVKKARHFEARWKMTENPHGQKKFISNQLYNVLKILHRIYVYRKLLLHHWWSACSSRDTNSGFKFWIWFRMIWGRRRVT